MNDERTDELATNLRTVEQRIDAACSAAGRPRDAVSLVVVTKTWPADDVRRVAALGIRDVGENRVQEAASKHAACADLGDVRWHLIGRLQRNKCGSVARWADVVHTLDRVEVVEALDRACGQTGRRLGALVQVSLDGDPGRAGVAVDGVPGLADAVAGSRMLDLLGVMAVAPLGVDPGPAFDRLAQVSALVRAGHPSASWVSAGMSGDLEAAVAAGATHVRVGSAVLGPRPPVG